MEECHIDHYHTRNLYPNETFLYENLLVSCNVEDYGAKHKDKQIKSKDDYGSLINPVKEDPTDYMDFGVTGRVQPVGACVKGEQTISFFNLNENSLVERRKTAVTCMLQMKDFLTEDEMVESIGEFETMIRQLYNDCMSIPDIAAVLPDTEVSGRESVIPSDSMHSIDKKLI